MPNLMKYGNSVIRQISHRAHKSLALLPILTAINLIRII
jgi:hypothetical protein